MVAFMMALMMASKMNFMTTFMMVMMLSNNHISIMLSLGFLGISLLLHSLFLQVSHGPVVTDWLVLGCEIVFV